MGASPPNTNIRPSSTAAAMPLRAVGHRRALLPAIGCGSYASFDGQIARVVAVDAAAHGV